MTAPVVLRTTSDDGIVNVPVTSCRTTTPVAPYAIPDIAADRIASAVVCHEAACPIDVVAEPAPLLSTPTATIKIPIAPIVFGVISSPQTSRDIQAPAMINIEKQTGTVMASPPMLSDH